MTAVIEVLKRARARLAVPGAWTKDENARNDRGGVVDPTDPAAVCWCAYGALFAECPSGSNDEAAGWAVAALQDAAGDSLVAPFNDAQETVAPILALFDAAIARLESGETAAERNAARFSKIPGGTAP